MSPVISLYSIPNWVYDQTNQYFEPDQRVTIPATQ